MQDTLKSKQLVNTSGRFLSHWTDGETAFVLTFADYCLETSIDYKTYVIEQFAKVSNRQVSDSAIRNKLDRLMATYSKPGESTSSDKFLREGTRCLNIQSLPPGVFEKMQMLRKWWNLEVLSKEDEAKRSAAESATIASGDTATSNSISLKRKIEAQGSKDSVSVSSASSVGNSTDDDVEFQPAEKDKKTRNQPPGQQGDTKAPKKRRAVESAITGARAASRIPVNALDHPRPYEPSGNVLGNSAQARFGTQTQGSLPTVAQSTASRQWLEESTATTQKKAARATLQAVPDPASKQAATLAALACTQVTPLVTTEDGTVMDMVKNLNQLVAVLMREQVTTGLGISEDAERRLRSIQRIHEQDPGCFVGKLLEDLHSADLAKAEMRGLIQSLVGQREFHRPNTFPRYVDRYEIDRAWQALRKHVHEGFGIGNFGLEPEGFDAGYISARIDDLSKSCRDAELGVPKQFLEELVPHLESALSAQAVVGALLCRWLFHGPESMCHNVYSPKEMKLFETLLLNDGAEEVQHFDKIGMKRLFEDKKFQSSEFKTRVEQLLCCLDFTFQKACPNAPGLYGMNNPQSWAENAVKLKETLMIARNDYRIHHCIPGSPFDSIWMKAEDVGGFELSDRDVQGKVVTTCLFPALFEQEPSPFAENLALTHILVANKNFYPDFKEKQGLDVNKVISKATVLVL